MGTGITANDSQLDIATNAEGDVYRFGQFEFVEELATPLPVRAWLAWCRTESTNHVVYQLDLRNHSGSIGEVADQLAVLAGIDNSHTLSIESFVVDERPATASAWIVTPYTGNPKSWVRLRDLLVAKGGALPAAEAERTVAHLLEASAAAHRAGVVHGEIGLDDLLVDRRGSVVVELYGLRRLAAGLTAVDPELRRDEVLSIAEIGYGLVVGDARSEPRLPASKLVKHIRRGFGAWLEMALAPDRGFDSPADAMRALLEEAAAPPEPVIRPTVRTFVNRMRRRSRSQ